MRLRTSSRNSRRRSASRNAPRQKVVIVDDCSSNSAHVRAEVLRGEVHGDTARLHEPDERVRDLLPRPLLHGEPSGEETDEPRQLRDPDDALVGHVADVREPVERQRVMLAQRMERSGPSMICASSASSVSPRLSAGNVVESFGSPS